MAKVAVVLSGSGVFDGSELHESVLTMLELEKQGIEYQTFAPDITQLHTINHQTGEATDGRNVLVESNRVSRGATQSLAELSYRDFDALVFVGGFGAAKNLSNFAVQGSEYTVEPSVAKAITEFNENGKWIFAMCIAPVLLAKTIPNVALTIGTDADTIGAIEPTGVNHVACSAIEHHVDEDNKVITTPAYMLASNLVELSSGIGGAIQALSTRL
ncbi:isoprenoid biosynthesis glyoxalase ElbB [Vibrio breoganii]|uniref:isoprenoid biosynthesis glyoxalase ElbB n=1 Tax=Vibrio breoganii TaxID=553239 RepID=UPI000C83A76B|nr:isoprenoid biosynthesis glyoxalase ElbB [Vibrio breoganii]PMK31647.1 isoprenoid biosynthesis protein ElbB [Vibrio breoganii]